MLNKWILCRKKDNVFKIVELMNKFESLKIKRLKNDGSVFCKMVQNSTPKLHQVDITIPIHFVRNYKLNFQV